jgi:hypothetical protein
VLKRDLPCLTISTGRVVPLVWHLYSEPGRHIGFAPLVPGQQKAVSHSNGWAGSY